MNETFCTIISQNGEIMYFFSEDEKRYGSLETKADKFEFSLLRAGSVEDLRVEKRLENVSSNITEAKNQRRWSPTRSFPDPTSRIIS